MWTVRGLAWYLGVAADGVADLERDGVTSADKGSPGMTGRAYTSPNLSADSMVLLSDVMTIEQGRFGIGLGGIVSETAIRSWWWKGHTAG